VKIRDSADYTAKNLETLKLQAKIPAMGFAGMYSPQSGG
jgi:hypothetical protein